MIHQTGEYPGMSHHEQPKLQNELSLYNYIVVLYCLYREEKQIEYFFLHLRRIHLIGANLQVEHISQVLQIRNRKTSWSFARATHHFYRSPELVIPCYTHLVILSHSRATSYDSHQFSSFFHFSTDSLPVATFGVPSCPIHVRLRG